MSLIDLEHSRFLYASTQRLTAAQLIIMTQI